jgi:hypothetical protein
MTRLLLVLLAAALVPAAGQAATRAPGPKPTPAPIPTGTLAVCNVSGSRPITAPLTYTLAAAASAGGTQTVSIAVGACSVQIFYPQGTSVIVTENVPAGDAVTSIAIGGGGSTLAANTPAAGSATVTIGSGQSLLTFTTSGPAPTALPRPCKVPFVVGLALTTAKATILKASCTVGHVGRAYSSTFRLGRVMTEKPRRGTLLAHAAPVDVIVSRGRRPW